MKKNILKYAVLLIIGIIIFILGFSSGISYKNHNENKEELYGIGENFFSSTTDQESIGKASLLINYGNGNIDSFNELNIPPNGKVIDLLEQIEKEALKKEYKDYGSGMGVFVTSLGGVGPDKEGKKWWQYFINNEYAKMGISTQSIKNGDIIEFKFSEEKL